MKKLLAMTCAMLMSVAASAQLEQMMQPLPIDPNVRMGKLDNGLTY